MDNGTDGTTEKILCKMDTKNIKLAYAELLDLMYNKDCDGVVLKL